MTPEAKPSPPYISHRTLLNVIDKLGDELPPVLDDSVLSFLSGGYRPQVVAALKALGLLDDKRVPTPDFSRLAGEPSQRKAILADAWRATYAPIYAQLDIEKATFGQLETAFKDAYGVEGETRRKAITFFVHGTQYNEMPLSGLIANKAKRPNGTAARRPRRARDAEDGTGTPKPPTPPANGTTVAVHPMLAGAVQWLSENGPTWTREELDMWASSFLTSVKLVYPPGRSAVSPADDDTDELPFE